MTPKNTWILVLTAVLMTLSAWWQPITAMVDCDAEAYVMGAHSIRSGLGYCEPSGSVLNHWPPGYSALLALFPDALVAAWWINLLSLGTAILLSYAMARRAGWEVVPALALAAIWGGGFFMVMSHSAKPDVLAYAAFLGSAWACTSARRGVRLLGLVLGSLVIPFKLIAMAFAPGFLLADLTKLGVARFLKTRWLEVLVGAAVWVAAVGFIVWFNNQSLHTSVPQSHGTTTLGSFVMELQRFVIDCLRAGLAFWHGSIRALPVLIPFIVTVAAGLACLLTLRPHATEAGRVFWRQGWAVFALCWAMEVYRSFFAGPRLMGYGMLLMIIGMRPLARAHRLWCIYALLICGLTGYNKLAHPTLGSNAPWAAAEARAAAEVIPSTAPLVYTNAWKVLDVHTARASLQQAGDDALPSGTFYWHVSRRDKDSNIPVMDVPPPEWPVVKTLPFSAVYQKP